MPHFRRLQMAFEVRSVIELEFILLCFAALGRDLGDLCSNKIHTSLFPTLGLGCESKRVC